MSEPYLILHKVRGEPAFDIAIQMHVEALGEDWWIIPTSGHRAYPTWTIELKELSFYRDDKDEDYYPVYCMHPISIDWPDHYPTPTKPTITMPVDLLTQLGLIEPIKRRL